MMDVIELKAMLRDSPEHIITILEHYDYEKIKQNHKEIRCARDEEGGGNAICIKLNDSLSSKDYARGMLEGDLFSLLMEHKGLSFGRVLNEIKSLLGIEKISLEKKEEYRPFGGIHFEAKKLSSSYEETDVKTYPLETLNKYKSGWNWKFLLDKILPNVQNDFMVGYDEDSNRITVPWFNQEGELIGVMGRANYDDYGDYKWFPVIPFSKMNSLFGYNINYKELINSDEIYIGESEKFVMQLASFGYKNAVALGGNNLSKKQIEYILSTNPKRIIFCYDEGLEDVVIIRNMKLLKSMCQMRTIEVYIIRDTKGKILPIESKASPSDFGKKKFDLLIKKYKKLVVTTKGGK